MKITPTSLTVTQLLGSQNEQYVIPSYQRRYSWHKKHLWELLDDIELIEGSDTHLLGSIVCLTGHHTAGINQLELVDGQQRITTISILLTCLLERLKQENEQTDAQDIERLLHAKALGSSPVKKISLDSLDSIEFDRMADGHAIENPKNPNLASAFSIFREWVSSKTLPEIGTFLYRLKNQAMVIRLDVSDAKDAFKLFETINNRGLRLSPTDIIKNFILGNAARFGKDELTLARQQWAALIENLDGTIFESFFRHYLGAKLKRKITRSFVIQNFKAIFMRQVSEAANLPDRHWWASENETPEEESDEPLDTGEPGEAVDSSDEAQVVTSEKLPQISFTKFLEELVAGSLVYGQLVRADTGVPAVDRRLL